MKSSTTGKVTRVKTRHLSLICFGTSLSLSHNMGQTPTYNLQKGLPPKRKVLTHYSGLVQHRPVSPQTHLERHRASREVPRRRHTALRMVPLKRIQRTRRNGPHGGIHVVTATKIQPRRLRCCDGDWPKMRFVQLTVADHHSRKLKYVREFGTPWQATSGRLFTSVELVVVHRSSLQRCESCPSFDWPLFCRHSIVLICGRA